MKINLATIAFFLWALLMWVNGHTIEATILFAVGLGLQSIETTVYFVLDEYFGRKHD